MGNSIDARKGRIAASPRATAASCSKLMGEHFCGGRSGACSTAGKTGHDQPDADMRAKNIPLLTGSPGTMIARPARSDTSRGEETTIPWPVRVL